MENRITTPLGYQQVNAAGTAAAFSLSLPGATNNGATPRFAVIQAETQGLRYRDDGTDPTTAVGMLIPAGDSIEYFGPLSKLRLINATAGAIANVSYYA